MKTLYVAQPKQQKFIFLALGALFLFQGLDNFTESGFGFHFWLSIIQIALSLFIILYGFSIGKSRYAPKIILSNTSIGFHRGMFSKAKKIHLADVKLIQLKPEVVSVTLSESNLSFTFPYEGTNRTSLMDELVAYAHSNEIPVERVSYN